MEHLHRAQLLMDQQRWELAEGELRRVLTDQPNFGPAHSLLALCLSARQQYAEATQEAQSGIHLMPDEAFGHYALARVYLDRNRDKEAREAAIAAIRVSPNNAAYWGLLALIEYRLRRWQAALAMAERGLAIDAEDSQCANARSMALVKLGRSEEATAVLADALAREPEDALSQANKGWALLERGDAKGAQVCFREALRLQPGLEWAQAGMVTALKARNPIYRLMLGYFLWMSKLTSGTQWALIVGFYFGYRLLHGAARITPAMQPFVLLITIAYLGFVLLTWLADPLFNLMLRLDRFGRHVLSRDQILGANLVGACALGTLVGLVAAAVLGSTSPLFFSLGCALLAVPCSAVFRCDKGWPRQAMSLYTAGLVLLALLALAGIVAEIPSLGVFGPLFLLGVFLSSWVANGLISATVRS